jgi:hypothetical protein
LNKRLNVTLYVVMVWLGILGILFLFVPGVAEKVMSAPLPDKVLTMLYGQVMLTFAYVAFLAARGGEGLIRLSRVILILAAGHVVIFGYQLTAGMSTFIQAGPPLIINLLFTILLFFFRKDIKYPKLPPSGKTPEI